MKRRVFFSFHYAADHWRAAQIRNAGVLEGNEPVSDNDWEAVKRGGNAAIRRWINQQMKGRSCVVVLIGENTAGRKWVNYEIQRAWANEQGLLGVYIHKLKDQHGHQAHRGQNPFDGFTICKAKRPLSAVARAYSTPPCATSQEAYAFITRHIADWVEEAIRIREHFSC